MYIVGEMNSEMTRQGFVKLADVCPKALRLLQEQVHSDGLVAEGGYTVYVNWGSFCICKTKKQNKKISYKM